MRQRALIVQPDYEPLSGFGNGAACIAQILRRRDFEIAQCSGAAATRAGILAALRELTDAAEADDAVVIYYVGHGGITSNSSYTPDDQLPRYIQHICPTDFGQTTDDDFRGISTFELSLQIAALTGKTRNVTVILECCYAAQLVRGDESETALRVSPTLTRVGLTKHLQAIRAQASGFSALELTGNPFAVRVAASGQTDCAYQLPVPPGDALRTIGLDLPAGGWIGGMTLRLAQILAEVRGAHVSWRSIAAELCARLVVQRPEIEGPITRVPFSLATVEAGAYPVHFDGDVATLDAGRLFGVSTGDVYGVVPAGTTRLDPAQRVPELTIDEVSAMRSASRRIRWPGAERTLPANAVALAKSLQLERYPVRVGTDEPAVRATLEAALHGSKRVRPAIPSDTDCLAELRVQAGQLVLLDAHGPLFAPAAYPARIADAVKDVENLATERRLRAMSGDEGLTADVDVQILVLGPAGPRALADGEALGERDRIAYRLENRTAQPLYANVFNIGLRRRIALLTAYAASGVELPPDEITYVGATVAGALEGFELAWPSGLPRDQPRLDTTLVVLTGAPADLRVLESAESLGVPRSVVSPLQALLDQLATGNTRGGGTATAVFALRWRGYRLFPIAAALDVGAPQVDANPPGALPRSPVNEAALRVLLDAHAVAAGLRIDVLVCARASRKPYQATTLLEARPGELELWRGDLQGVVDVYVWSSTATADHRTLAELLALPRLAITEADLRTPGAALGEGVSLQLAAMARGALLGLAPDLATAFRGSFGADDLAPRTYRAACGSFGLSFTRR